MTRVQFVGAADAPDSVKRFYANGDPGPIATSMAQVPDLMAMALPFVGRALGPSSIDFRTKEIVILRASRLQACAYCTGSHSAIALQAGLTPQQVAALRGDGDIEQAFESAAERALIAWVEAVAASASEIPASALADLREHFAEAQVVELTVTAAATVMLNRYATAFALPVADAHLTQLKAHGWS